MKKTDFEKAASALYRIAEKSRLAFTGAVKLDEKLKFHTIEKKVIDLRRDLISLVLDIEDMETYNKIYYEGRE